MFGLSLFASLMVITQIWARLTQHDVGAAAGVPTLSIVLGAARAVAHGDRAHWHGSPYGAAVPYAAGAQTLALFYGLSTWGFALLWLVIAAAITVRTARRGLPFRLTSWSFTFPVGAVVTGTSGLAGRTGLTVLAAAAALSVFLLLAWGTVLFRTIRGATRGELFLPPRAISLAA